MPWGRLRRGLNRDHSPLKSGIAPFLPARFAFPRRTAAGQEGRRKDRPAIGPGPARGCDPRILPPGRACTCAGVEGQSDLHRRVSRSGTDAARADPRFANSCRCGPWTRHRFSLKRAAPGMRSSAASLPAGVGGRLRRRAAGRIFRDRYLEFRYAAESKAAHAEASGGPESAQNDAGCP